MKRLWPAIVLSIALLAPARPAFAQAPRDGKLIVTVADPSGGVVPGATVTVVGLEDVTKAARIAPAKTSDKGIATFEGLAIGRYSVKAEFPGFELGLVPDFRVKSGDNKHVVILPLKKVESAVTVGPDKQAAAADRATAMGTALTREQIALLSDDPDEMRRQLQDIAGPDAVIRVDSFEGAQLPPKAMIKSIHITRNTFAAESHYAGFGFIDIITQPGVGPIRVGTNYSLRDGSMTGSNPFTPKKGPERSQSFGGNIGGTLIKDKSTFSLSMDGSTAFTTPNLHSNTGSGTQSEALINLRQPSQSFYTYGLLDYAITRDQTVRMGFNVSSNSGKNQGVGGYNQPERTYSSDSQFGSFRIQEAGPLGRRFFTNTRLQVNWSDSSSHATTEAVTIVVPDAFTSGGAQVKGGQHNKYFNFASDLDYVRGIHSVRTGVQLDGTFFHSDSARNYLGTYTFTSLAAYQANQPATFTKQTGDPIVDYFNLNAGIYVQDDIRLRKNLTLSPGVRYEVQTHLSDYGGISPRFGITWSPFKSGKTSLQASWGIFHDWLSTGTYQQTLLFDGTHQLDLNIANPSYPDPGAAGTISPTNRYLLGPDLRMQRVQRVSAGWSQTITPRFRINNNYSYSRLSRIMRGVNLNAPVNGVRPDPAFVNVFETVADASSLQHSLSTNASLSFAAPSPALNKDRFNWRRGSINAYYNFGWNRNNSDGAFGVPVTGSLAGEWAPSSFDIRHRLQLGINTQALKNLSASLYIIASSGQPYNETTGLDNNGDLIFNDRPAGVSRNALRMPGQWNINGNFSYGFTFGKATTPPPGAGPIQISMVNGVMSAAQMPGSAAGRYRFNINVSVQNLTNHTILGGYSGNMLSPFFMTATSAPSVRRVYIGSSLSF
jgi:hypothetical protein